MRLATLFPFVTFLALNTGCNNKDDETDTVDTHDWSICEDADLDGVCPEDGDCDDSNPNIAPGVKEVCNGVDDNCNGVTDEGMSDVDGDGICDNQDTEECDGVDNDGDGMVDEDFGDSDGDGTADCLEEEVCDGLDNNGDGNVDEGFDADSDGYTQCGELSGENVDCDDGSSDIHPGATETIDSADNDCDGLVDEDSWVVGDLVITEIMANPLGVADNLGEWFEVHNASDRDAYLDGLIIQSGAGEFHAIRPGTMLEAGGYMSMGANDNVDVNGGANIDYVYSDIVMTNQQDEIAIWMFDRTTSGTNATLLDQVYWSEEGEFPYEAGASMALEPLFSSSDENDDGTSWCLADLAWGEGTDLGTPGEANGPCASYDHDGDGYSKVEGDCDDTDDTIYAGAPEIDASVDNDCDGIAELGPEAVAVEGSASNAQQCGTVTLDGTGSYDPGGDTALTYEWTLVSAPATSSLTSADIFDATTDFAGVVPDVAGTYTFALTVRDSGNAASAPADVVVVVASRTSNTAPTADAGEHQTHDGIQSCPKSGSTYKCSACDDYEFTVNGDDSSDSDGDGLEYLWNISSGTGRIYNRWAESTKVIVSGPRPYYDTTESEFVSMTNTVFVDLVVTDCMGANSSVDTIALSYTCEGREEL